ncbi:MAG TPA: DUF4157 domain-containing protein, partial [Streptosporangiaceae bacterium]|nr:DUF4157 domain-containing protein [Streptosporangiaceae bacterium]
MIAHRLARRSVGQPVRLRAPATRDVTRGVTPGVPARRAGAGGGRAAGVLTLQRTAGNAAVSRLIARGQRDSVRAALTGSSRRLPVGVRADMEGRLGADFSDVRLHTGRAAGEAARDVEAKAFTTGSHVVFGQG